MAINNSTNKYFRAAEMSHYHRLGMGGDERDSEKRAAFRGASPTISELEFTRKANREHIEKQHFEWNRSFDAVSDTKARDF